MRELARLGSFTDSQLAACRRSVWVTSSAIRRPLSETRQTDLVYPVGVSVLTWV